MLYTASTPIFVPSHHQCYNRALTHLEEILTLEAFVLIAQIIIGVVLTVLVVLGTQNSGAGSMFGSDTTVYRTRRGLEKTIYQATIIVTALFFIVSIIAAYVIG